MHEVLRALVERLGPGIFDDPDNFRGALDDVLDDDVSLGDQNLVVDAVRLGAYASMATMFEQGGDPASTVAQAGARLARDRGGDDLTSATWACACLAYAVGAMGEAEVQAYRTARRRTLDPPPPPPLTGPSPVPVQSPPAPPTYVEPEPERAPMGGRWLVPVLVVLALVAAITVGVLAAQRLGGDDEPSTASDTPSTTPSTTPPTTATTPTSPTTEPTTPPTTPTTPTSPTSTAPTPVATRVENTCANGDCFLSERAAPHADAPELGTHNNGTVIRVVCEVLGQDISSSKLGTSSKVWAQTVNGGYVAAIFLSGIDKYAVTTPC